MLKPFSNYFLKLKMPKAAEVDDAEGSSEIINYALAYVAKRDLIENEISRYAETKKLPKAQRDIERIPLYLALEHFICNNRPPITKRPATKEELRNTIRSAINLKDIPEEFRVLFAQGNTQNLIFYEIVANFIEKYMIKGLGPVQVSNILKLAGKNTVLEEIGIKNDRINFDPVNERVGLSSKEVTNAFADLIKSFYEEISRYFGQQVSTKVFNDLYDFVKNTYGYEFTVKLLDVLPLNVLETERLTLLSRKELETRVAEAVKSEKEKAFEAEKIASEFQDKVRKIEEQNKDLEEAKLAMLNVLEDAKLLQEELKKEKEGVERKVLERTRELSEEKEKLSASINSFPSGFIITNKEGEIIITNNKLSEVLDRQNIDGKGFVWSIQKLSEVLGEKPQLKQKLDECLKSNKLVVVKELDYKTKILELVFAPIQNPADQKDPNNGAIILVNDVTEAKSLERTRDEFFSIASHELRTPLTAIRGNASLIKEIFKDKVTDPEFWETIDDIHEASVRLIKIVNDFLNTSKLEQGRFTFKIGSFDVQELIEHSVHELEPTAEEKGLKLVFYKHTEPVIANSDRDKIKEVLDNLIGNAIKYSDEGAITVEAVREGGFVKVSVTDSGQGIPLQTQHLLFRKFQQAEENIYTRDSNRGTGLGLYISKLIVESLGGRIFLEQTGESGSKFSFTTPAQT